MDTDHNLSPGEPCPLPDCEGALREAPVENCSCHINPPCAACMRAGVECPVCGEHFPYEY